MPEFKLFYKNCTCCAGSESSGSGSASCFCSFFNVLCPTSPVKTNCQKNFVVNITLNFSGCVGTQMGSCGSGSGISGPETGLDVDGSGSTGSDCRKTCKPCCELVPFSYELNLECFNDILAVPELNGDCIPVGSHECLGNRLNCPFFTIDSGLSGYFGNLFDDGYLTIIFNGAILDSCSPLVISGTLNGIATNLSTCLRSCLEGFNQPEFYPTCITGTFTITEALP